MNSATQVVKDPKAYWDNVRSTVRRLDLLDMRIREQAEALDGIKSVTYDKEGSSGGAAGDAIGGMVARREEDLKRLETQEISCSALVKQAQSVIDSMRRGNVDGTPCCNAMAIEIMQEYYIYGKSTGEVSRDIGYSRGYVAQMRANGCAASASFMPMVSE